MELGATVVREIAKMGGNAKQSVTYDPEQKLFQVQLLNQEAFFLEAAVVRRHDTSAASINEWTGEPMQVEVPDDIGAMGVQPVGNYAVQITWEDGFNQVASFELLGSLEHLAVKPAMMKIGGVELTAEISG
jgi:DUF971 family protein